MSRDLENATKAAQGASLLVADLRALMASDNPLLSDMALNELGVAATLCGRLQRLQANLETMESQS
jgi:hypothetical protein